MSGEEPSGVVVASRWNGVLTSTSHLSREHVVECSRGRILVLDPVKLLNSACECHAVVKREYRRLFPPKLAI